ncbi:hypothetical protein MTO96_029767 [Rhipicephalus appendiculatus]
MYGTVHAHVADFFRPRIILKTKPSAEELTAYEDNVLALAVEVPIVDLNKYPKLVSYYKSIKSQLPYFEELYGPAINHIKMQWAALQ